MFTVFYIYSKTQNPNAVVFTIILAIIFFIIAFQDAEAQQGGFSFIADHSGPTLGEMVSDFGEGIGNIFKSYWGSVATQVNYAITGEVEENKYEPLGVYLEDVRPAIARYIERDGVTDEVVIWGTVKAKTLDEPIKVQVGCYAKDDKEKTPVEDVDPKDAFEVLTMEEQDFTCVFKDCDEDASDDCIPSKLKLGSSTVVTL